MSQPALFGTDGMRGAFGQPPLEEATLRRLGAALGRQLTTAGPSRPRVVIGGDTRESTPTIVAWLAAELAAAGADCVPVGVLPTPGIAATTIALGAACGVAVSASHNPYPDNGVKLIDAAGGKWTPVAEAALERAMAALDPSDLDGGVASVATDREAVELYLAQLRASVGDTRFDGLRVALDAGNGAAFALARPLFESLGAEVELLHAAPDGRNVNAGCGSTHPQVVADGVRSLGCDLGFSFDGDADRALMADELGAVRDGDAILYLWARALADADALPGRLIVATSMSNLGLEVALRRHAIGLVRCDVGDRAVVETMTREGIVLGGEQSGHIVDRRLSTTGDGLLTALQLTALRARAGRPLSELLAGFQRFPQTLKSYRVARKPRLADLPAVVAAERSIEERLGDQGRLVLRYSGTENLVRIMIEGPDASLIDAMERELADVLLRELA
jgi:phosphoglucosamine mutase